MKDFIAALLLIAFFGPLYGNSPIIIRESLQWEESPAVVTGGGKQSELWSFAGAVQSDSRAGLPLFVRQFPVEGQGRLTVEVVEARYEPFDWTPAPGVQQELEASLQIATAITRSAGHYTGSLSFVPIVDRGGNYERLVAFTLRVTFLPAPPRPSLRGPQNTRQSVLREGAIYKIAVQQTGIHKITYDFLRDELGVEVGDIDPQRIQLFGNGGGMVPANAQADRPDDLIENAILVEGEADGSFDPGDFILFYAEGADKWSYLPEDDRFVMEKNIYDHNNYYFLKIGAEQGLRVTAQPSLSNTATTTTSFDDVARHEEDQRNLLHDWRPLTQGSGVRWYSDHFKNKREFEYEGLFRFPNLDPGSPATVEVEMALRATSPSTFNAQVGGNNFTSSLAGRVNDLTNNEEDYAEIARLRETTQLNNESVDIRIAYPYPSGSGDGSEGWLDFIQVRARRQLIFTGDQMTFRDVRTLDFPSATFQLRGAGENVRLWDVTQPLQPRAQEVDPNGDQLSFGLATAQQLRTLVAFRLDGNFPAPASAGEVDNQNLHGLDNLDMIIVTHPDFAEEARRLAEHRRSHSRLEVEVVRTDQIYNEFSSGRVDPAAIRDFARMLYERNSNFRYLLLFGDGSFDCRDIYGLGTNFIPVYETDDFNPILTFPSDDFYGLLDDEQTENLRGGLDIAIGRIPVKTPEEATGVVNKIINYDTNSKSLGDWRNRLAFVADDQDRDTHVRQAEQIADTMTARYSYLNLDKIYLDAFPQESTPGGTRFPDATEAISQAVFRGTLVITYLGHGGAGGLAEERVLEIPDILNWENYDQPPLLITATCSFAGYDDPAFVSAGEEAILNARGGAISLLTTVRAVYSSLNKRLTEEAMKTLFERPEGKLQTIGEAMMRAKNRLTSGGIETNSRKFTLLGDPAMHLAQPAYSIQTTAVNGQPAGQRLDTLGALQKVTIEGQVLTQAGTPLESFNGIIYPTIFDKETLARTLGQDSDSSEFPYDLQKNVIFKGRATVQNGAFSFTFVIPKDINYQFGRGKISYYASDEQTLTDATGASREIVIGGTDADAAADDRGPKVEVFMNSEDFAFGGITNASPTLLVALEDDNGINVVGNSIGHDLEAVLDDDTQNTILLNDFYESELDDYRTGTVRYPLATLEEGRHTIRVKAWDVANNSSEGYTEFVVASSGEIALEHVLNYPNPFTDYTCFQFDHNLPNQELDIQVQIFTISGRLVKTLEKTMFSDGALRRDNCLEWDGHDDFGDPLARGVYLYKVKVRTSNTGTTTLEGESAFEKLVLLK